MTKFKEVETAVAGFAGELDREKASIDE